jgi:hypothetical protein
MKMIQISTILVDGRLDTMKQAATVRSSSRCDASTVKLENRLIARLLNK